MVGILLVSHGSRRKETENTLEYILELVKEKFKDSIIEIAYMEFGDVNISEGLNNLVNQGVDDIKVIPYFLFDGIHIKKDIPEEIEKYRNLNSNIKITMGKTLGRDPRLADIIADRIREVLV